MRSVPGSSPSATVCTNLKIHVTPPPRSPTAEGRDAAVVWLVQFGFRPTERFLYEYDFTAGWQVEVRVEKVIEEAPCESHRIAACLAGRVPGPPDGCGGPRAYAERRRDAVSWDMATDMDAVAAVLAGPETFLEFKQAVSRLRSREPFLAEAFPPAAIYAALRQAFTIVRVPDDPDPSGRCFGFVQTVDDKPRARLVDTLSQQGMQPQQQVVFLSGGADTLRCLQQNTAPEAEPCWIGTMSPCG